MRSDLSPQAGRGESSSPIQFSNSQQRSRGSFSPGFCNFVVPLERKGRGESRVLDAPVDPVRRSTRASRMPEHAGKDYRYSRDSPAFPAQWFDGLYVLSPVSGLSCHRCRARTGGPDRRQGRGARTTRFHRTLQALRQTWRTTPALTASHCSLHPTCRDVRETSPFVGAG